MLENGRCQIRDLYQPWLSGRARLQRSGSEVWPGGGDQPQAWRDTCVRETGKQDVGTLGRGLEHGGNPGVDGGDLLGAAGVGRV